MILKFRRRSHKAFSSIELNALGDRQLFSHVIIDSLTVSHFIKKMIWDFRGTFLELTCWLYPGPFNFKHFPPSL